MILNTNTPKVFTLFFFNLLITSFCVTAQQDYNFEKFRKAEMNSFTVLHADNFSGYHQKKNNIVYACCRWILDPAVNYIRGSITYYFIPEENSFDSLVLDLSNPLIVDSVLYKNSSVSFTHNEDRLNILFPDTLSPGLMDSVKIFYGGSPVPTGNGSFIQSEHSGTPVIYTLSEPFGSRDWWPCKQDPGDKIDSIDIYVQSPVEYRTASNGLLISDDSIGNTRTCHWKSNYPIAAYLVAIGITNYSVFSEQLILSNGDTLQIVNYVYPETFQLAQQILPGIKDVIHLYDSLIIPYPFSKEKYGHAQFGWGGGMEHQTMSFIGTIDAELIAHECAHQWFGDEITCRSWSDVWLHEGFATYFSGLVVENLHPDNWRAWKRANLDAAVSKPGGSIYCDDTISFSRIFDGRLSYRKASCLLHMIRWKIGDTSFFNALKNYLNDTSIAYGYAGTSDLKNHFEQASGQDLTEFFNEWYYGSGYPSYTLEWESNKNSFDVTISQSASDPSVSFFHVPVPLELKNENHDTIVIAYPVSSGQTFQFNPGFKVEEVIFDPDIWLISKNNRVVNKSGRFDEQIDVYPNPGDGLFNIHSKKRELFLLNVIVFDQLGKIVFSVIYSDNISKRKIDLSGMSKGIYILKMETGNGVLVRKLVIYK